MNIHHTATKGLRALTGANDIRSEGEGEEGDDPLLQFLDKNLGLGDNFREGVQYANTGSWHAGKL